MKLKRGLSIILLMAITVIGLGAAKSTKIYDTVQTELTEENYEKTGDAALLAQVESGLVSFGYYEQNNNTADGKEIIEWLVLTREDNKALLVSKYALDCQQYHSSLTGITWEKCSLRSWLNSTFLSEAFTPDEQKQILTATVSADRNPSWNIDAGNSTQDKIFLLSIDEVNIYFSSDFERWYRPTEYAVSQMCYVDNNNGNCGWWLRSPGIDQYFAAYVDTSGAVYHYGNNVNRSGYAIRPAFWINLDS